MSTLMFWNKQNGGNSQNNLDGKNGKRNWLHAPEALLNGHVVYLVKFLGNTPVDQPKGIEVVKDAIRKLQFNQQIKKAETGNAAKLKKVEITISVDGVAIQEPRTRKVLFQYPLHNISYCADEKGVKKFFSFIAKQNNNQQQNSVKEMNGHEKPPVNDKPSADEKHECFVFVSSKLASDITLTIGQAFDLAYRRYVEENGKSSEINKTQQKNKYLENALTAYRNRLRELSNIVPKNELNQMLERMGIKDIFELPPEEVSSDSNLVNGNKNSDENDEKLLIETSSNKSNNSFAPIIPPRNLQNQINNTLEAFKTSSGQKADELLLNSDSDSDFDPRAEESDNNGSKISNDLFGFEPKSFGQQLFNNGSSNNASNGMTNGNEVQNGNIIFNGSGTSSINSPPLLAPPPKATVPRRSNPVGPQISNTNGFTSGSQDLFGSVPFNPNAPSIFDKKSGSENSFNDEKVAKEYAAGETTLPMSFSSFPSLQLNSTVIEDTSHTERTFGGPLTYSSSQSAIPNLSNPFAESGIFEMNDSSTNKANLNIIASDLNAFTNNSSKLDTALKSTNSLDTEINQMNQFETNKNNTIGAILNRSTELNTSGISSFSLPISNPFAKKGTAAADILLNPRARNITTSSNYDALRNSPDFDYVRESSSIQSSFSNTTTSNPIMIKVNSENFLGVHNVFGSNAGSISGGSGFASEASSAGPNSAASSFDIFKDAASKAFSELSPSGHTGASFPMKNTAPNEFSNQMFN